MSKDDILNFIRNDIKVCIAQVQPELTDFMFWLQDKDIKRILEIGIFEGGTLMCWKFLFPTAYACGIDIGGNDHSPLHELGNKYGFNLMLNTDSHHPETFEKLRHEKFDMLFIDGDHTYEGVKKDFEMYSSLVTENGMVVIHDIKDTQHHRDSNCFVGKFWNEIKDKHEVREFMEMGTNWGGIGVIRI